MAAKHFVVAMVALEDPIELHSHCYLAMLFDWDLMLRCNLRNLSLHSLVEYLLVDDVAALVLVVKLEDMGQGIVVEEDKHLADTPLDSDFHKDNSLEEEDQHFVDTYFVLAIQEDHTMADQRLEVDNFLDSVDAMLLVALHHDDTLVGQHFLDNPVEFHMAALPPDNFLVGNFDLKKSMKNDNEKT